MSADAEAPPGTIDDKVLLARLSALLEEFLNAREKPDGLTMIYRSYGDWLQRRELMVDEHEEE